MIAIVVIIILLLGSFMSSSSGSGSSSSSQPWKELGVSKSEYMKIYNKIKYGN